MRFNRSSSTLETLTNSIVPTGPQAQDHLANYQKRFIVAAIMAGITAITGTNTLINGQVNIHHMVPPFSFFTNYFEENFSVSAAVR